MKKNILTFLIVVFGILLFHIVSTLTVARGDIVRVGVIDGPLSRKIAVTNNIEHTYNLIYSNGDNHGDMVIETIKSQAPKSEIYYAQGMDGNMGNVERIIDAVYWLQKQKVDVVCLSFTAMSDNSDLYNAIKELTDAGVVVLAACLNYSDVLTYPAAYKNVISVSNINHPTATICITDKQKKEAIKNSTKWNDCSTSALTAFIVGHIADEKAAGIFDENAFIKKHNS